MHTHSHIHLHTYTHASCVGSAAHSAISCKEFPSLFNCSECFPPVKSLLYVMLFRFVYPPNRAWYSKQPVLQWYNHVMSSGGFESSEAVADADGDVSISVSSKPLQCMQYSGDLIYIPRDWGHGVINTQNTIGVSVLLL